MTARHLLEVCRALVDHDDVALHGSMDDAAVQAWVDRQRALLVELRVALASYGGSPAPLVQTAVNVAPSLPPLRR
jgi:hypothetical protein